MKIKVSENEKNCNEKLLKNKEETDFMLMECEKRMKNILNKKDNQLNKLKRLLEKTVKDYETEKQKTQNILNLREKQMNELTKINLSSI